MNDKRVGPRRSHLPRAHRLPSLHCLEDRARRMLTLQRRVRREGERPRRLRSPLRAGLRRLRRSLSDEREEEEEEGVANTDRLTLRSRAHALLLLYRRLQRRSQLSEMRRANQASRSGLVGVDSILQSRRLRSPRTTSTFLRAERRWWIHSATPRDTTNEVEDLNSNWGRHVGLTMSSRELARRRIRPMR